MMTSSISQMKRQKRFDVREQQNVTVVEKIVKPQYTTKGYRFSKGEIIKSQNIQDLDFTMIAIPHVQDLSDIDQGDNINNREGNVIYVVALDLRFYMTNNTIDGGTVATASGFNFRIVVIRDNRGGVTAPTAISLYNSNNEFNLGFPMAILDDRKRYTVLVDEMISIGRYRPEWKRIYRDLNFRTRYSTSVGTNHQQGTMWMIFGSITILTAPPHIAWHSSVKFYSKNS